MVLLLRADAEQRWLNREVIPVLRQLETRDPLPDEHAGAALAYLKDSWSQALLRARQTDDAHLQSSCASDSGIGRDAVRYHTAVRALRGIVSERVSAYVRTVASDEAVCARIA